MTTPHLIEQLDVDIEIDSTGDEERMLVRLLEDTLLPVVDEVLDAHDEPGTILSVPSLTLDLGTIERGALHEQAPVRLRALLEDAIALARRQARLAAGQAGDAVRVSATDDAMGQLATFLASGRIAWHADMARKDVHVTLLDRLLSGAREALLRMLAGAIAQPHALRRLSEQFPARQLAALVKATAPGQAAALLDWRAQAHGGTWATVLGVAFSARAGATGLLALAMAESEQGGTVPDVAQFDWLMAWWRRGERDPAHAAMLEQSMEGAPTAGLRANLRRAVTAMLATPAGRDKLMAALPQRLRARVIQFAAPAAATRLLGVLSDVERQLVARVSDRRRAAQVQAQCWLSVFDACLDGGLAPSNAMLGTRMRALVAAAEQGGGAPGRSDIVELAAVLERGRFDTLVGSVSQMHVVLLDRILARADGGGLLKGMLVGLLDKPGVLRRLSTQFPERQLAALVRMVAPERAGPLLAVIADAGDWELAVRLALDDAMAPLAQLAAFLDTGRLYHEGDHAALLKDVLERVAYSAAVRGALLRMLETARPEALRRLVAQFPRRQLAALAAASSDHAASWRMEFVDAIAAEPAGTSQASDPLPATTSRDAPAEQHDREHAIAIAVDSTTSVAQALATLTAYFSTDRNATGPVAAQIALLDQVLTQGDPDARAALQRTLTRPSALRRLARHFPHRQLIALLEAAPPRASPWRRALEASLKWTPDDLAQMAAIVDGDLQSMPLRPPPDGFKRHQLGAAVQAALAEPPSRPVTDELAQFAAYLGTGRLARQTSDDPDDHHIALLDRLIERAVRVTSMRDALLRVLAEALARPPALHRLISQFPQRQLAAVVRLAATDHGAMLLDLFVEVQGAARLDALASDSATQDAWRAALMRALASRAATPPALADVNEIAAAWQAGVYRPACAARLEQLLVQAAMPHADALCASLQLALARTLAVPGGARCLVDAVPERVRESLLWFALPATAAESIALVHGASWSTAQADDCWTKVFEGHTAPLRARPRDDPAHTGNVQRYAQHNPHAALRLIDRLPERQLRDIVLRAAPEQGARMLDLIVPLYAVGALLRIAPQRLRPALWSVLLDAVGTPGALPTVDAVRARLCAVLRELPKTAQPVTPQRGADPAGQLAIMRDLIGDSDLMAIAEIAARRAHARPGYPLAAAWSALLDTASTTPTSAQIARLRAAWFGGPAPAGLRLVSTTTRAPWQSTAHGIGSTLARRVLDDLPPPEALDSAAWQARIRAHLDADTRVPAPRRQAMLEAIGQAATASTQEQDFLRLALATLVDGAALDLESIAQALRAGVDRPVPAAWTRKVLRRPAWRAALVDRLPEPALGRLVEVIAPDVAAAMEMLLNGGTTVAPILGERWRRTLWQAAARHLYLPTTKAAACTAILRSAAGPAPHAQAALVLAWHARGAAEAAGAPQPGAAPGERVAVANAGMVLMAPYLPRLFGMLGLLADGAFVDAAAAERAAHLLQFAVSGETDAPEYQLSLNKLLCGLPLDAPVPAAIELTPVERETIDGLLEAMIASWSALGRTSIDGLRQSFLIRAGELELDAAEMWRLAVVAGPFDMLMDRLPWSFSIVKFAWMPLPLHVTWH